MKPLGSRFLKGLGEAGHYVTRYGGHERKLGNSKTFLPAMNNTLIENQMCSESEVFAAALTCAAFCSFTAAVVMQMHAHFVLCVPSCSAYKH